MVGFGTGASGRNPWPVATTVVTPAGITPLLEVPSRFFPLPPTNPFCPGENPIPLGMGGIYGSGVLSFLKPSFWVKEAVL
jgi:hypothetical protein